MPDEPANLKKVLFVDDNLQFLEMVERVMGGWSNGEWRIFLAENTGQALIVLQEQKIDLVIVDVQMPVVDGIQFLALLNRKYPSLQKITLSAYADDAARAACLSNGAELFLEKPRSTEGLEIIFTTLRELARHKPATGFRGVLREASLESVIQMECLNRNSSILEIKAGGWVGQIYIKEGALIHAQVGERNGEAALNKILSLAGGEFNLKPFEEPPQESIDGQWEFLLMEAARVRDENGENETEEPPAPSPDLPVPAPPTFAPAFSPAPAPAPAPVDEDRPARINEMVVCSARGDVLYEWQCADVNDRISFLEFLSQKSTQLGEGLDLGPFDRLEVEGGRTRVIAQVKPDRGIFIRATRGQTAKPSEPAR